MFMSKLSGELEQFFNSAQSEIEQVLRRLITPADSPIPNLDDGLAYALGLDEQATSAGKRVRPMLCLLVSDSICGQTAPAIGFAAAIELMHNFCLVHDDIEDGDEFRRGRGAVWKQFGLPHAINIGDYLFTKVFEALLWNCDSQPPGRTIRFFQLMSSTLDHTHRGQALDMNARSGTITMPQYMRLVLEKTGYYLAAPLVAGAIACDAGSEIESALHRFGLKIGPMFQIRDDLIDLTHGKGRETVGSDIREGKRSFLVAHALEQANSTAKNELLKILDSPREKTSAGDVQRAIAIFDECGSFNEASRTCNDLQKQALAELERLPALLSSRLGEITNYLAERTA
jgi:geranylgeranyl pyrophosphate synthase